MVPLSEWFFVGVLGKPLVGLGKFFRLVGVGAIGAVDTGSSDNGTSGEPKVSVGGKF